MRFMDWPELEYEIEVVVRRYDDANGLLINEPIELHIYEEKLSVDPSSENVFDIMDGLKMDVDDAIRRDMTEYQLTKGEDLHDEREDDRIKQEYHRRKYSDPS